MPLTPLSSHLSPQFPLHSLFFRLDEANVLAFWLAHCDNMCNFRVVQVQHLATLDMRYVSNEWFSSRADKQGWFSSNVKLSYAYRIMGSPGGKHCKSLQRNVWLGASSPLKAVSLDRECRILPWFYEKRRWVMLLLWNCKFLWNQCYEIYR